jgi:hypothetical protein
MCFWPCFEFALIRPDVEADLDLRDDHTGADIYYLYR